MGTIATGRQTRWPDCYAPSERVKLTLRTNGEEETLVITPQGGLIPAGFPAPTVAATMATATVGGTILKNLYYYYVYVYASTQYPFVQNAQTIAGGELWPRSNPSPISAAILTGSGTDTNTITATATKTTRSDVDKIVFYKTVGSLDAAEALAQAQAGQYWYAGVVSNNSIPGTEDFVDSAPTVQSELIELDNYEADTAWFCEFDGTYWWMCGNPRYDATTTLSLTNSITVTSGFPALFSGRDGQVVTFDGITSGGYDGQGGFFVRITSATTFSLYLDQDLTAPATFPFSGTTTFHMKGFSSILYRSKPYNPFSWGLTESIINEDGSTTIIPQSFNIEMGGGAVTALLSMNGGRLLKVDFENPQRTVTYDLSLADDPDFARTAKVVDNTGSVTGNFTQFQGFVGNQSVTLGLDTYNGNVLACDGVRQYIISSVLGDFLANLDRSDDVHRFFHGNYDPGTELNCWWVRYLDTDAPLNTLIWNHSTTNQWGWMFDFNIQSSSTCLDSETNERFLIGGTNEGQIGRLFNLDWYDNWINGIGWRDGLTISSTATGGSRLRLTIGLQFDVLVNVVGQAITSVNPTAGTFVTTGDPQCAVGDTVFLAEVSFGAVLDHTGVVGSINGNIITLTAPWIAAGSANSMMVSPARVDGTWGMIYSVDKKNQWYFQSTFISYDLDTLIIQVDQYMERGTTDVMESSASAPWSNGAYVAFGNIPCYARFYFDLDQPTINKRASEAWLTATDVDGHSFNGSADTNYQLAIRQYTDFNELSSTTRTFALKRDLLPGPDLIPSDVWFTHNLVPSTELKQMGFEVSEIGFDPFTLYNLSFGVRKTS